MKRALHVGCGGQRLPAFMQGDFLEVRCDVDASFSPDIVADARNLGNIGTFDFLYSVHMLEHFYPHEVPVVLSEFKRVTAGGGAFCIVVPNLEGITADDRVIYTAPCGPITGFDMIFGKREFVAANPLMAHHTGFTGASLKKALDRAGFYDVKVISDGENGHNLIATGRSL